MTAVIDQLEKLEESLWTTDTRFDSAYMDRIFAPDFVEFGCSGRRYAREVMLGVTGDRLDAVLPLRDFAVRLVGDDAALVTYVSEVSYADRVQLCRRSSLWTREDGVWRLRFHQGTPVTQEQLDDA
jgi:hypothetical protein